MFSVKNTAQGSASAPSVSSLSASAQNVTAGNLLVVAVSMYDTSDTNVASIQDTAGNNSNFTLIPGATFTPPGSAPSSIAFYYVKNCLGNAANVVTVNFIASQAYCNVFVWQIEGADLVSPLDTGGVSTGFGAAPATVEVGSFSTSQANEIVCMIAADNSGLANYTGMTGTFSIDSTPGGFHASMSPAYTASAGHATFSSTQSGITPGFVATQSANTVAVAAASFIQAAAPSSVPNSLMMVGLGL